VDGTLRHWEARTGIELGAYPAVGSGLRPSLSANGRALVADLATQSATLIDTQPRAELWAVDTCPGFVWAQTLSVTDRHGALSVECTDGEHRTYVIDLAAEKVTYELQGHRAQDLAVSPDGTRFVRQEADAPGRQELGAVLGARAYANLRRASRSSSSTACATGTNPPPSHGRSRGVQTPQPPLSLSSTGH
jgi:hypothetical protein